MMLSELMNPLDELRNCSLCPQNCNADRFSHQLGYCNNDYGFNISSICLHLGEEPVLSGGNGICNIFFSHCNMQCIYCQNYQISRNSSMNDLQMNIDEIINRICKILDGGCDKIGFVSPSHQIVQMKVIINALRQTGRNPVIVFNTNSYDKVETLRSLEDYIDIYLPDIKYFDAKLAKLYSDVNDYPETAFLALKEMFRQKGSYLSKNEKGEAERGLIIRHLVLPGYSKDSISILRKIADEISVSVHISLMSQYYTTQQVKDSPEINRTVTIEEYHAVIEEMEKLGFYRGWIQEHESCNYYQPDFRKKHPFK